jgi:hypothetical protein
MAHATAPLFGAQIAVSAFSCRKSGKALDINQIANIYTGYQFD